jgi:hypothetical protein
MTAVQHLQEGGCPLPPEARHPLFLRSTRGPVQFALNQHRPPGSRRRDAGIPADLSRQEVRDLRVPRHGGSPARPGVPPPRMSRAFALELAAMTAQMPKERPLLHTETFSSEEPLPAASRASRRFISRASARAPSSIADRCLLVKATRTGPGRCSGATVSVSLPNSSRRLLPQVLREQPAIEGSILARHGTAARGSGGLPCPHSRPLPPSRLRRTPHPFGGGHSIGAAGTDSARLPSSHNDLPDGPRRKGAVREVIEGDPPDVRRKARYRHCNSRAGFPLRRGCLPAPRERQAGRRARARRGVSCAHRGEVGCIASRGDRAYAVR